MKKIILTWTTLLLASVAPRLGLAQTSTNQPQPTEVAPASPADLTGPQMPPLPEYYVEDKPSYIKSGAGMYLLGGGGATGFTQTAATDVSKIGGAYDVRLVVGSRLPIALEAAYIGTANSMTALGLGNNALLYSNGAEGNLRLNLTSKSVIQPYVAAGAAWKHYNLHSAQNTTSDVKSSDDTLEVPMAAGIAMRLGGFIADVRGAYRQSFSNDMIGNANLSNWAAKLNIGLEF